MDELAAIADANGGYLMRGQLNSLGMTDDEIRGRCRTGDLKRVRHGTYVVVAVWALLDEVQRHVVLARSVLDKLGDAVVATHQTACALHGLNLWDCDLSEVHVTRIDGRQGRREAGVVHHQGVVDPSDVVEIDGRLVIHPMRAAIEVATQSIESGLVVISSMMRVTGVERPEVRTRIEALRHWPGIRMADVAARLSDGRLESVGEARSLYMFWRFKLPFPDLQKEIVNSFGVVLARTDFYWELYRHTGEFDGMVKYGRLNPYERDAGRVLTDEKAREDAIRAQDLGMTRWVWPELGMHVQTRTAARIREDMERSRRLYARNAVSIA